MDKVAAYFADELEYEGAFYGMPMMTSKDQVVQYMQGWHSAMDNIKYEAENFCGDLTGRPQSYFCVMTLLIRDY